MAEPDSQPDLQSASGPSSSADADPVILADRIRDLVDDRRRLLRQRRVHLLLLGLAISLPVHMAIMIWLWSSHREMPAGVAPATVMLDLSILPDETLQDMLEPSETEDLLTPELATDAGAESLALERELNAEVPDFELDASGGGLETVVSGSGAGLGTGLGSGLGAGASFFGIQSTGNRFAYIVDISGSMGQDDKMPAAMAELKRSLKSLPDYAAFAVILYSSEPVVPPFQNGWLRASRGNLSRISAWIDGLQPGGGTFPLPAFDLAFRQDVRPDVVFFLTDGLIPKVTPSAVRELNESGSGRVAVINCIAFGSGAGQEPMRQIAAESDGIFRFVPTGVFP
ncbi:MAG: hypothetical protein OSA40_01850 [Phycisphaerales bacterium]|nr:hypothetical protein [Phycisphaerales bacterium]